MVEGLLGLVLVENFSLFVVWCSLLAKNIRV
jgi:hypothetical protein